MSTLPSHALALFDRTGNPFGFIRFAPAADDTKGECIFDIRLTGAEQEARPEVRWLLKRNYRQTGEHRFKVDREGALTISQADFRVVLDPTEHDEVSTRPPAPVVTASWVYEE